MKKLFYIIICNLMIGINLCASFSLLGNEKNIVKETRYFEFHNNFWINLHFYVHELAASEEIAWQEIVEPEILSKLNQKDLDVFQQIINYYRGHLDLKNNFNEVSVGIRKWLVQFNEAEELPTSNFDTLFVNHLNTFKTVYSTFFWETHSKTNVSRLIANQGLIESIEEVIISKISELAKADWQNDKIRIDLSVKSPGGGAFTLGRQPSSIVLSTVLNYYEPQGDWVEMLFHEAGHTVIKPRRGKITETINKTSEELGIKPPRGLWHAMLFYMVGKLCQDAFPDYGINDYSMYMIRENEFEFYHDALIQYFNLYVEGVESLEKTTSNIVHHVFKKRELGKAIGVFNEAFKKCDIIKLDSMITENYQHTNSGSQAIGKVEWMNYLKKRKDIINSGTLLIEAYDMSEVKTNILGTTAIITGLVTVTSIQDGIKSDKRFRMTNIWIWESGKWKRAGFHDTKIE